MLVSPIIRLVGKNSVRLMAFIDVLDATRVEVKKDIVETNYIYGKMFKING